MLLFVCYIAAMAVNAQRVTYRFDNVSMNDALKHQQRIIGLFRVLFHWWGRVIFHEVNYCVAKTLQQSVNFCPIFKTIKGDNEIQLKSTN